MADFYDQTLFKSGAHHRRFLLANTHFKSSAHPRNFFLAKPTSCAAINISEELQRKAKQALTQYCSFPEVRHLPHQSTIEAQSRAWLADLYQGHLPAARVQRLLDTRLDTLGCFFYPHGSSDAHSLTLNKLIHWFFLLDDVMDDPHLLGHNYEAARRFACRHFKVMFGGDMTAMKVVGITSDEDGTFNDDGSDDEVQINVTHSPSAVASHPNTQYTTSLAKVQQDLVIEVGVQWACEMRDLGMSPKQLERLREAVADYFAGIVGMTRLRQERRLPNLEEYIHLRRLDGAKKLYHLGCEYDLGIVLDNETLEHPLVKRFHDISTDQLNWLNDLLSFKREYHNKDYINLVAVLQYNNHNCKSIPIDGDDNAAAAVALRLEDFQESINEARAMISDVDQERVRLASEIIAWKPDLQPYVEATHFAISGVTFWSLWSQRYQTMGPI